MAYDRDSAAIVKALVGLRSGLSLALTAERVEDPQQRAMLIEQGYQQAEGFLFRKALPANEALAMLNPRRLARRA